MLNQRPQTLRASHAQSWFSLGMVGLFLFYLVIIWLLERINLGAWLSGLLPLAPTFIIDIIALGWRIFRHVIPVIVGWWFAYQAAVETIERLYDLPDKEAARAFLGLLRSPNIYTKHGLPLHPQTLEADRAGSVLLRLGGPGKVKVESHMAAVTEDNGRFARILPPGSHQLQPFEFVHAVVDLRQQERTATATARTRDNIDLTATFSVMYCIRRGDDPPTESRPFPFDETAVRAAAYAHTVMGDLTASTWENKPVSTARSKLAAAIGRYRLDEIMHPPGRSDEPYRTLQREVWRTARTELANYGIELISVHIERLEAHKDIEDLYIKYWQSRWEAQANLSRVDGEATAVEEIEIARAEAEVAMIQAILEGIQRARHSGAATRTSDIVALRLVEGLERMAEKSRATHDVLPALTDIRSELLASTTLPPGQPLEGAGKP